MEIPDHQHVQSITFVNIQNQFFYGFGGGWQASLFLPYQIRSSQIEYRLTNGGEAYTPPYAGIHHRNERLYGFGDAELSVQYFHSRSLYLLGVILNSSIPFGQVEENPYALGLESKPHQHFQMGTGTFVPSVELVVGRSKAKSGLLSRYRFEYPYSENKYNYKTGTAQRWSIGYWRLIQPKLTLMAQFQGHHEQPDTWLGFPAPFSGRNAIGLGVSTSWRVRKSKELLFRLERNVWEKPILEEDDIDESIPPAIIFSFGFSVI